jgi:hypothetical protein
MNLSLRESIRRQIKKSLNEWFNRHPEWYQKKPQIKEMEVLHKKENETYEEYEKRMMKNPGHRYSDKYNTADWKYEGSHKEAWEQYREWKKEQEAKKAAEEQERKKEELARQEAEYNKKKPLFDKEIEKLKKAPFYDQTVKELEGKNYDETLLDVVICSKNKKAGNSIERWRDGFLSFSPSGVTKVFRSLWYYKPDTKEGHYASLCISRQTMGNHYGNKAYEEVYIKKYYVDKDPDYKTYRQSLSDDYYHSQRE